MPLCVVLDVAGQLFFWPSWQGAVDYQRMDIVPGNQLVQIVPDFTWPDTGTQSAFGLVFHGALLNESLNAILGGNNGYDAFVFGYGPL